MKLFITFKQAVKNFQLCTLIKKTSQQLIVININTTRIKLNIYYLKKRVWKNIVIK
jgi:hypothetical protein